MRLANGAKPSPFHMKNLKWLMPVDIIILYEGQTTIQAGING